MNLLDKSRIIFPDLRERRSRFSDDTRVKIARGAIIVVVLAISAVIGLLTKDKDQWIIAAGIIGVIAGVTGLLFASEHLSWGLILLMVTAIFTPFSLPTGTNSRIVDSMVVTMLFLGLWVLRMLIVDKRFALVRSPANLPLLGFMLVALISWVWSIAFRDPGVIVWSTFPFVQFASAIMMILLPGAFLFVGNYAKNKSMLIAITVLMLLGGTIGVVGSFAGRNIVNNGGLMAMWTIALAVSLFFFSDSLPLWVKGFLGAVTAAWLVYSFVLHISWVAGWLPGMVAIAVLLFLRSRKLFVVAVLLMLVVTFVFKDYYLNRVKEEQAISGDSRVAAWEVNWRVTGEHLLFGTGPGGYAAYYMTYFPTEGMATHNNYIDIIAETGLVGMGLWLWFLGALFWQGTRLALRLKGRGDFYEALANAALAGTVACVIIAGFGDWLIPFAYTQTIAGFDYAVYSWIFMGTIVAVDHLIPAAASGGVEHA